MNFYKRHIGDYIKKAGHLTLLEHGVYARLMDVYYTREAGIPEDKAARLIGARGKDELQALANVLDEFFTLVDGAWTQGRCEEEIGNASDKAEQNRENGRKGGRPRKPVTNTQPNENPNGFDVGNHVGFENNLSQTPDSRLQTTDLGSSAATQTELSALDEGAVVTAAGLITMAMKPFGINANPGSLIIQSLAKQGVKPETVTAACEEAKRSKPTEAIGPTYVIRIIERWARESTQLNAAGAAQPRAAYQTSNDKAREWAAGLTGRNRNEQPDTPEFVDINPAPGDVD